MVEIFQEGCWSIQTPVEVKVYMRMGRSLRQEENGFSRWGGSCFCRFYWFILIFLGRIVPCVHTTILVLHRADPYQWYNVTTLLQYTNV